MNDIPLKIIYTMGRLPGGHQMNESGWLVAVTYVELDGVEEGESWTAARLSASRRIPRVVKLMKSILLYLGLRLATQHLGLSPGACG